MQLRVSTDHTPRLLLLSCNGPPSLVTSLRQQPLLLRFCTCSSHISGTILPQRLLMKGAVPAVRIDPFEEMSEEWPDYPG
jgi:hypothetical protein